MVSGLVARGGGGADGGDGECFGWFRDTAGGYEGGGGNGDGAAVGAVAGASVGGGGVDCGGGGYFGCSRGTAGG